MPTTFVEIYISTFIYIVLEILKMNKLIEDGQKQLVNQEQNLKIVDMRARIK